MFSLVLKDLLVQKKMLLFSLVYVLIMILAFQSQDGIIMLIAGIAAVSYIMVQTACAYDDRNKADIMLNSLPIGRGSIVLARYISVLLFIIIGLADYALIAIACIIFKLPIRIYPLAMEGLLGALFSVVLINSIFLPAFYKFGYIKSKWVNFIMFFSTFFLIGGINFTLEKSQNNSTITNMLDYLKGLSDIQIVIGLILIMIVMFIGSYFLAAKFYKTREF